MATPVSFHVDLAAGRTEMDRTSTEIWRPGGMDGWILNYTVSGRGRIGRGSDAIHTAPGRFLLFKPLAVHDYGADPEVGEWVHLWVYFFPRRHWFDWLVWPEVAAGILSRDLTDDPLLERTVACFHDVVTTARGPWQRRDALALSQLEQLLLWLDAARGDAPGGVLDERIRAAVEHCHERYAHAWTVAELAAVAGMSASRFAHRFREVMGSSPVAYLEQIRLQAAKDLLLFSGRSIADIADAVGIPDAAWFAKRFRRWSGLAPRRFRQVGGTRHGSP